MLAEAKFILQNESSNFGKMKSILKNFLLYRNMSKLSNTIVSICDRIKHETLGWIPLLSQQTLMVVKMIKN